MAISKNLRDLTEQEREKQWELARDRTAGPIPDPATFQTNQISKYPPWMIRLVVFLAMCVLVAAFIPSAYRLYLAGSSSFCEAMNAYMQGDEAPPATSPPLAEQFDDRCNQVGYATIMLAEIGQIIFLLCLATIARGAVERRIFWSGVILSTLVALFGNAFIAEPWRHGGYIFKWMEAFVPPLIVAFVGYALKELFLHFIEERRATGIAIKKAEVERLARYNDPEKQASWARHYSIALRDGYKRANARYKPDLQALTPDDWQHIIKRQMLSGEYTVDVTAETAYERAEREAKERAERDRLENERKLEEARVKALSAPPSEREKIIQELPAETIDAVNASVENTQTEQPEGGEVWLIDPDKGLWAVKSTLSGKVLRSDHISAADAKKHLNDYNYRWNRRQNLTK